MIFPSLSPGKSPLSGSQTSTVEAQFQTQSRETGELEPVTRTQNAPSTTKAEPVVKPWAHFVAGGYEE